MPGKEELYLFELSTNERNNYYGKFNGNKQIQYYQQHFDHPCKMGFQIRPTAMSRLVFLT